MPDRDVVDKWLVDDVCEVVQELSAALVVIIGMPAASDLIGRLDAIRQRLQASGDDDD